MSRELIFKEEDGTLSFGDYTLQVKSKVDNFEFNGDLYKVKTFHEITKLEQNGMFVYESVPGSTVEHLEVTEKGIEFHVKSAGDVQITLGLEPEKEYKIYIDETNVGKMKTNLSGKLNLSVEKNTEEGSAIKALKC